MFERSKSLGRRHVPEGTRQASGSGRPSGGSWAAGRSFTGVARRHEDIDLVIWLRDLPLLRDHVGDRHHLWMPATTRRPRAPRGRRDQVWLRDHATAPWFLDCILARTATGCGSAAATSARGAAGRRHLGGRRRHPLHAARGRAAPQGRSPAQGHVDLEVAWPLLDPAAPGCRRRPRERLDPGSMTTWRVTAQPPPVDRPPLVVRPTSAGGLASTCAVRRRVGRPRRRRRHQVAPAPAGGR